MLLKNWLRSFGGTQRRQNSRRHSMAAVEHLEDRSLLSVAALFVNGELFVSSDGGDSIAIRQNAANRVEVLANGAILGTAPNVATSSVTSIVVKGGDSANSIDLNLVTNLTYPSITSIRVDAGNGNDLIVGSPFFGDSILGGDGQDTITGQGGADTIDGGNGNDSIVGGDGDDSLIGQDGNDTISGDAGNDTISGGNHQDLITGGDGNDSIDAGQSNDTVSGGNGDDTINGSDGADSLAGDAGNDSILGGAANDSISGGDGNDTLLGQSGVDTVSGNLGDDLINGGEGNDLLSGNEGNDTVNGSGGNDSIFGNEGDDKLLGGNGNDTLDGFIGNDSIFGQGGNDSLLGGGGIDSLDGGAGADVVDSADPIPDPIPVTITVADSSVIEGNAGTSNLVFTITLSAANFAPVTVNVSTADGSATAGSDYTALINQPVTFAPGTTTQTVIVSVNGDTINEPNEIVRLVLSNPTNARLQNQEGIGTILDDDAPPAVLFATTFGGQLDRINPTTAAATPVGSMGRFAVHDITVDANGTMLGYTQIGPTLFTVNTATAATALRTFVNGAALGANIEGDMAFDTVSNSIYYVTFTAVGNPHLFRIDPNNGAVTDIGNITVGGANLAGNNDNVDMDYLAIRNGTLFCVVGGGITGTNANFNDALFTIDPTTAAATRIGALGVNITPQAGGLEYDPANDRFLLLEGATGNLYQINRTTGAASLIGSTGLSNPDPATGLSFATVVARAPRSISVSDISITEGNQGTKVATFTVTAGAGNVPVTVGYATVDGTATAGSDYVATSGSLNFGAGGGTQTVSVVINGDYAFEPDQTFFLQLSNPTGAVIADGSGIGTILNDDAPAQGDTVLGNTGNDTLIGGPAGDFMNGDGGNDLIFGNGGDDTILGGASADTINGGDGNDSIDGQGGPDVINSGSGDDLFVWGGGSAGSGNDTLTNASGADGVLVSLDGAANVVTIGQTAIPVGGSFGFLQVTEGGATLTIDSSIPQVTVAGGNGDDTISVTNIDLVCRGSIVLQGNNGDDLLTGQNAKIGAMRLRMEGDDGNDTIVGTQGNDTLSGDAGNDRIKGGLGNDLIFGGTGIDSLNGDGGDDTLIGGDGSDTLIGDGADTLSGDAGNDSLRGDQGNDILSGGDGNDTASGGDGNDTITGDNGNDSLLGDSGMDSISGGNGDDTLDGGRNDDILNGGAGDDRVRGDHGNDTISGGSGNDTINGGDGNDVIQGQTGNDLITGADGNDFVNGGDGQDIITGGDGDDTLLGGNGNDVVLGEQGDDLVNGQGSTDTLAGGQGDDTIIAAAAGEVNEQFVLPAAIITDLNA